MAKTIQLIFTGSPNVSLNETINLSVDTGLGIIDFSETFKTVRSSLFEVTLASPYTSNQQAINFANAWNLDYKISSITAGVRDDLKAYVTDNIVTIAAKTDTWVWQIPTGTSIDSGSINYIIPVVNNVTVTSYNESSIPCVLVDVLLNITGGTAPYDIYKESNLLFSGVSATPTISLVRGEAYFLTVFDSLGAEIGFVAIDDTTAINDYDITYIENGENADVTITIPTVSDTIKPVNYSLNGVDYGISNIFLNQPKGAYTAYVRDSLGCIKQKSFTIGDGLVYFSDFKDERNILHRIEIIKNGYLENPVEIIADAFLDYPDCKENQEPFKPCSLTLNMLATQSLSFTDLYTEEERIYRVIYKRDGVTLFNGFLSPDGLYESFVEDKWYLDLQAIDGLGFLKDLAYVEDATGLNFVGKQTAFDVIVNCLKRTKLDNGIRTSVNIFYTGLSDVDVLKNVYVNAERYIKDEENNVMDCEQVLKSILEIFNASITFFEGYWYIYRANELFDDAVVNFYNYDSDGTFIDIVNKNFSFSVGSQIDNFYPHHVNANQKKSLQRSLGAYKVGLKWGNVFPYYNNTSLIWTDSTNIDEWNILEPTEITPYESLRGFYIIRPLITIQIVATSDLYVVSGSPALDCSFTFSDTNTFSTSGFPVQFAQGTAINVKLKYVKGSNTYWLDRNGKWGGDTLIQYAIAKGETDFTLRVVSENVPEPDGSLFFELYNCGFRNATRPLIINNITLKTFAGEGQAIGKDYTVEKLLNPPPSTNDSIKQVYNGDVEDGTYYATIYENDEITETTTWYRKYKTETKELLRIMAEDRMKMNWLPKLIFEGDYYGYVPYLAVCQINNISGKFMAIDYSYDAKNNITSIKYLQLQNQNITDDDIVYLSTLNYGNVTKPTIKG